MSIENIFIVAIVLGAVGGTILAASLWNLLHLFLHRELENILLREPYYSPAEIGFFSVWPFSLVITSAYILLITIPAIPKMKRFATFDEPLPTNAFLRIACWIMLLLAPIITVSSIAIAVFPLFLHNTS